MTKINYFSLGGQDEKWKYSGVLEINNDVYILNTGVGCAINNQYGIQKVVPDLDYVQQKAAQIRGIFIGTPRQLNIGSLPYFLNILPDVPIYTSVIGKEIILAFLDEFSKTSKKTYKPNIMVANPVNDISVGSLKVSPIKVANSIPNSYAWLFQLITGECIVFVDEFLISNENIPCCENQICHIIQAAKNRTALLIVGTQSVGKVPSFAFQQAQNFHYLKKACSSTKKRVLVACYEDDWHTLLNLSKIAKIYSMNFYLTNKKIEKLLTSFLDQNKNPDYAYPNKQYKDDDSLIVLVGDHEYLYDHIQEIADDKDEFKFQDDDLLIIATSTLAEKEIVEINLVNNISHHNITIVKQPSSIIPYAAGNEDLKSLINGISPFNIIPVNCHYKDYINLVKSLENTINTNRVKFLELGQAVEIEGKKTSTYSIPIFENYVNFDSVINLHKNIILERQLITQNGALVLSVLYHQIKHVFVLGPIDFLGVFVEDFTKTDEVKKHLNTQLNQELGKFLTLNKSFDIKTLKIYIKKVVGNVIDNYTQKKPIILSLITTFN